MHQHYSKLKPALFIFSAILFFNACSKSNSNPTPKNTTPTTAVTSLSVSTGPFNTGVVITGTGFSSTPSNDQVFFNGKAATVTAATSTQLTVTVPLGANTGNVTISVNNGSAVNGPVFTYQLSNIISIFAGNGSGVFSDGIGAAASFRLPYGIAVDATGNVYVADNENNKIRKITPAGLVSTFAAAISPGGITVDAAGNVYFTEIGTGTIKKATPAGVVSIIAGSGNYGYGSANGIGAAASFNQPTGIAVDATGNLYVADQLNCLIRKITPAGLVTTFAGIVNSVLKNNPPVDGPGASATFQFPSGIAIDASGNLYVADRGYGIIRKITPGGLVSTLAGNYSQFGTADGLGTAAEFFQPSGVCVDISGNVYVADIYANIVRKISPAGMVTTIAGIQDNGGLINGPATTAHFNSPVDVAVDAAGNIYVTDNSTYVHKISMQ